MTGTWIVCSACDGREGWMDTDGTWHCCDMCEGKGGYWETDDDHAGGFGITMIDDYGQEPKTQAGAMSEQNGHPLHHAYGKTIAALQEECARLRAEVAHLNKFLADLITAVHVEHPLPPSVTHAAQMAHAYMLNPAQFASWAQRQAAAGQLFA